MLCTTDVLIYSFVKCLSQVKCSESESLKRDFPNLIAFVTLIDSERDFEKVLFKENKEWFTTFKQLACPVSSQRIIVLPVPLTESIKDYDNDQMVSLVPIQENSMVKLGVFVAASVLLTWHAIKY